MLLSYCYIFSHSPHHACDVHSSLRQSRDAEPSPAPTEQAESDSSLLSSFSDWSTDVASSLRSSIPFSLTLLSDQASAEDIKSARTYPGPSQASVLPVSFASWFSSSSDGNRTSQPVSARASASVTPVQVKEPEKEAAVVRTTTFTFCLFGAATTAAIYALVRNRRTMNRLQSAKSMAYRDARAWRRVALDFAKINAMAASRVQNLVAASLREGKAGGEIGRQIERELEEATRAVAQRRNFIQEQDRKDAEAAASSGSQRPFGNAWSDVFDPFHGTGFFFGSREGRRGSDLGEYGRWKPSKLTRHDDVSSASSDGLAFKPSEPWSRCKASDPAPSARSAKLKWQRVVGHSCAAPPSTATATAAGRSSAQTDTREDWIGDVDLAIRERDRKSSLSASASDQAAVDAFSRLESEVAVDAEQSVLTGHESGRETAKEDEEDHLLPVSDLSIATNGQIREALEEPTKRSMAVSKLKRTRIGPATTEKQAADADKYSYPISDEFKDLHDIFIAAWDDNFAGLSNAAATETRPTLKSDGPTQGSEAKPNRALFEQLRSQRAQKGSVKADAKSSSEADEIEFMAELMFPSAAPQVSATSPKPASVQAPPAPVVEEQELAKQLEQKQAELASYKSKINDLSERLDTMREMCHDLTDEASRREKTHRIQVEQLDHKIGLFTVWAEEVQRRLGLETPPFFASLRKPLKKD